MGKIKGFVDLKGWQIGKKLSGVIHSLNTLKP
jgi:hypothetical protein